MSLFLFFGLVIVVLGLIHLYLWKRLVRDPLRPGPARRAGGAIAILLGLMVPTTLIGVRTGKVDWIAWPGYLWIALMFYLLVVLAVLEIPRLAISLRLRARAKPTATAEPATSAASPARMAAEPAPETVGPGADATEPAGPKSADGAGTSRPAEFAGSTIPQTGMNAALDDPANQEAAGASSTKTQEPENQPAVGDDEAKAISRRLLLARGTAIFAGLTAAGITGYGVKTALGPPQLDRVQLPLAKLPRAMDGTRLAVVSDIHLGPLTGSRHAGRIVDLINSVDADVVCIVGDLVDGTVAELGRFAEPLAHIRSRRGAYFVTGNHEYYSGYQEWVAEVARLGVRPLRNERLELDGLDLAGVNDIGGADFGDGPDLGRALGDRDTARPVVLMAHQPRAAFDAAPYGVDLQVSGHTHGGQMAPFNLLVPLQQPVTSGLGKVDGVPVYVTNGAGFWGPPVRVGAPPQVTVIELRTP